MTAHDTEAVLKPDSLEAPPLNEHELKTQNEANSDLSKTLA